MSIIYQGEEKPIAISISNDGVAEDVTTYTAIYVYLLNNRRKVAQYAFPVTDGYEAIEFDVTDTSKIIFTLTQEVSETLSKGKMDVEIKVTQAEGARVVMKVTDIEVQEAQTRAI
jgi:hypothetical protein